MESASGVGCGQASGRTNSPRAPRYPPPRSLTPPQDRGTEQRSQSEFLQPYSALGPVETMRRVAPALNGNMSVSHRREIINIKPHG